METISSLTESTLNEFSRMLSQRSNFGSFFIDIRQKAKPARKEFHRCLSKHEKNSIAYRVIAETILSMTESTQKRFL
jgi:hypothetical protein